MSPRAACRLETLGYTDVYDYVGGKADWLAAGLPSQGHDADQPRAGSAADPNVPTCGLDEALHDVARRIHTAAAGTAIVINADRVVLGRLRLGRFPEDSADPASTSMEEGPTTFRASEPLAALLERMRQRGTAQVIVTTPEGQLLGIVGRSARS
jgi:CBS domain-containing protein